MSITRIKRCYWVCIPLVVSAIGALVLSLSGCDNASATNADSARNSIPGGEVPRVQTVTVVTQDLSRKIELPGTVEGYETVDLYAKVGGFLHEFAIHPETKQPIDIGDRVAKDQVLAKLWIPEMHEELKEKQAAVASAEAMSNQAQAALDEATVELREKTFQLDFRLAEFQRIKGLVERGSLNAKLLDEVTYQRNAAQAAVETVQARIRTAAAQLASTKAKVQLAEAERDKVETLLQYGEIRAPFAGVITHRYFDRGAFIQPAEGNSAARPLFTLTRTDIVRINLDLPMAEVRWLNRGDKAVLDRINVLPGAQFTGEITRFAASLNRTSRMMRIEVDLDNPENQLLPGYYGYVTLFLDEFPHTPVIPSSALMTEGNEMFVYCVDGGSLCRKCVVTTNYQDGTIVGIGSGLNGGEQIVQAGAGQLADGQRVVAVNAKSGT